MYIDKEVIGKETLAFLNTIALLSVIVKENSPGIFYRPLENSKNPAAGLPS